MFNLPAKTIELLSSEKTKWRIVRVKKAVGSLKQLKNGNWEVSKNSPKGIIFFVNRKDIDIIPGKNYNVSLLFKTSSPELKGSIMLSMPGGKRTPYPCAKAKSPTGKTQVIKLNFQARADEKKLRIHLVLTGKGNATISSVKLTPITPAANLLKNPAIDWAIRSLNGGQGKLKKLDNGYYEITKRGNKGLLAFIPEKDRCIIPGKKYYTAIEFKSLDGAAKCSMMLSMPGSKRTPYPSTRTFFNSKQPQTAEYIFTANPDEKKLRIHLIIRNQGKIIVSKVILREATAKDIAKQQTANNLSQSIFTKNSLIQNWHAIGAIKKYEDKDYLKISAGMRGGIQCDRLNWDAKKIKAIEVKFQSKDEPGYLRLDFFSQKDGKNYTSYQCMSCTVGKWHYIYFPVAEDSAWMGKIKKIRLTWYSTAPGIISFASVKGLKFPNLIPNARHLQAHKEIKLGLLRPRGQYLLQWHDGSCPGANIRIVNRDYKTLKTISCPIGSFKTAFELPLNAMTAFITINKESTAWPQLKLIKLPRFGTAASWRGSWIWSNNGFGPNNSYIWFKRTFKLPAKPEEALFEITGDDAYSLYVNNQKIGEGSNWTHPNIYNITHALKAGHNEITVRVFNVQAWGGLLCEMYANIGKKPFYIASNEQWKFKIGDRIKPQKINSPVMVLGAPPVAPWGNRMKYQYIGPVGVIDIQKANTGSFTAKVLQIPQIDTDRIKFKIVKSNGKTVTQQGYITPSTSHWKQGKTINVEFKLPPAASPGSKVYINSRCLKVKNNKLVGYLKHIPSTSKKLSTAKIINPGKRPFIKVNNQLIPPIYFYIPGSFRNDPTGRDIFVKNAVNSGNKIIRIGCKLADGWHSDGTLEFSKLDRCMEVIQMNSSSLYCIVNIDCHMPEWWLKKNPDHLTAYYGNKDRNPTKDKQTLASKKWLKDVRPAMAALIKHIKQQPYADRIIGFAVSEGWNSEWFWPYADVNSKSARSGFSIAAIEAYRNFLRKKYKTSNALAKAWHRPGLTFDKVLPPSTSRQDSGSIIALLSPQKDYDLIDFFEFRNQIIAEAIVALCKIIKEETAGKWLTGAYYGYLIAFSNIHNRLQTVGHLAISNVTKSPYIDFITGPSFYTWRRTGMADSPMQPVDSFSIHNKLVIVEQDARTYSDPSHYEARNGKLYTVEQSLGGMERAFGMQVARGLGTHWLEMYETWYRDKIMLDEIRHQIDVYAKLPAPKGTTPIEVCLISDTESAFYCKHNAGDGIHQAVIAGLLRRINEGAFPFRHVLLSDILTPGLVPAHKVYIVTNLFMLDNSERKKLLERFEREKATVIWLYAPGVFFPNRGPDPRFITELLKLKFTMLKQKVALKMNFKQGLPVDSAKNTNATGPWFLPVKGFDSILAETANKQPAMVQWQHNSVKHYFSPIGNLPPKLLSYIAGKSGVHIYSNSGDPMHIGNDVVFLHAKTAGTKSIILPDGCFMQSIYGPLKGRIQSGQKWNAVAGRTYGFVVKSFK
jgi:hypothetical protein